MEFIDSLDGELLVEEEARLPLSVDGKRVSISGIVDLIHVRPDRIEVVDFKTDIGRHAESEYRKQMSVYYHVVRETQPEREVDVSIFYTHEGDRQQLEPMSKSELQDLVAELL